MKDGILEELLPRVRRNAMVSDARFWGYYSICGLLLRLRQMYMFEEGLKPWERVEREKVASWIGRRESQWCEAQSGNYEGLVLRGRRYEPFDAGGVNSVITGHGLLYGAGYGHFLKPVFFLADLEGVSETGGCTVYTAGREYVRDLSVHPAMLQGRSVFARRQATETLIHEKFEEFRAARSRGALWAAFTAYGITPESGPEEILRVAEAELATYVHHEVGEARETEKTGGDWTAMLLQMGQCRETAFMRALKDMLADTSEQGMVKHITDGRKAGSMGFFIAFLAGFRKSLARPLEEAYQTFRTSGGWDTLEAARRACYQDCRDRAERLLSIYRRGGDAAALKEAAGPGPPG